MFCARLPAGTPSSAPCTADNACDDHQGCTADTCAENTCVHAQIPGCVPCVGVYVCPPVDIVFIMDTSGSMRDEAEALCTGMHQLVTDLQGLGITVNPRFLGITQAPADDHFSCLTDHVVGLLGEQVPGDAEACPFPATLSAYESWGPATAIVAERFPWTVDAARLIVPISDEGPCDGSRPSGCNDPGDDRASVENAIARAVANGVIVSPVAGTGSDACVINLGTALANGTGGIAVQSQNPKHDLTDMITEIVLDRCSFDDRCDDANVCTTNDRCTNSACTGTPIGGCVPCQSAANCDDHNPCTSDACREQMCVYADLHDDSVACCNPNEGSLTPVDDGDPCTLDLCDPRTGAVAHPPAPQGVICDDQHLCTMSDRCNGAGNCVGTDVGNVACSQDADCGGLHCNVNAQRCVCNDIPDLCLTIRTETPPAACVSPNADVMVTLDLGESSHVITGAQAFIAYDAALLDFVDIEPGAVFDPSSPFLNVVLVEVDEAVGTIFYAVGVPPGTNGTRGPAPLGRIRFRPLEACTSGEVCFAVDTNLRRTLLSDDVGAMTHFAGCCEAAVRTQGPPPQLECPASVEVNARAGGQTATVTWAPPSAVSECDGALPRSCTATHSEGIGISTLVSAGGVFPVGVSEFECTAVDSCGQSASCSWSVNVRPMNTVRVDVQYSPILVSSLLHRCIEFEFYETCAQPPVVIRQTLDFGGLFNFAGRASRVMLKVPAGKYGCVTARDPHHTLRSSSEIRSEGGVYTASFHGDPIYGGNWLIAGNLDGDNEQGSPRVIDLIDQALLMARYATTVSPHTPCGTEGVHADITGDRVVDTNDLSFIQRHFLATDRNACCPDATAGGGAEPAAAIPVERLEALGLVALRHADRNGDGVIDARELTSFAQRGLSMTAGASDPAAQTARSRRYVKEPSAGAVPDGSRQRRADSVE